VELGWRRLVDASTRPQIRVSCFSQSYSQTAQNKGKTGKMQTRENANKKERKKDNREKPLRKSILQMLQPSAAAALAACECTLRTKTRKK
jgi:hypothetical protein